jgi:hypothetical protein
MANHLASKSGQPNYVRQAVEKILADQKDINLPRLPAEQYHSFLGRFTSPIVYFLTKILRRFSQHPPR